jgi:hypothetical protein
VGVLSKSLVIGVGGTLAYYGLIYLAMLGMPGADWTEHQIRYHAFGFLGEALLVPLIPGALPGMILAIVFARLGIVEVGRSPHDGEWMIFCGVSAPLVHAYFVNRWLKRRERQKVACLDGST